MAPVVVTMGEIGVASRKISSITAIVDSIAVQTNILAINAAGEAARSGGQGRGFAVFAREVWALASSTAAEVTASVQRDLVISAVIASKAANQ